jgi:hypothetical protein
MAISSDGAIEATHATVLNVEHSNCMKQQHVISYSTHIATYTHQSNCQFPGQSSEKECLRSSTMRWSVELPLLFTVGLWLFAFF